MNILTSEVCDLSSEAGPGPEPETELEDAIYRPGRGRPALHALVTCTSRVLCDVSLILINFNNENKIMCTHYTNAVNVITYLSLSFYRENCD